MRLVNRKDVVPLGPGWGRVRPLLSGICGSDLATIGGQVVASTSRRWSRSRSSRATRSSASSSTTSTTSPQGTRIALEPVLSLPRARPRPVPELRRRPHRPLRPRHDRPRERRPADRLLRRHRRRLEQDVRRAPLAAAPGARRALRTQGGPRRAALVRGPHRAPRATSSRTPNVVVIGAGTVGILTLLALKELTKAGHDRRRGQARQAAGVGGGVRRERDRRAEGGDERRPTRHHAMKLKPERGAPFLLGGADVAIDCVGSRSSRWTSRSGSTRAGGRVVVSRHPDARAPTSRRCGSASSSSSAPTRAGSRRSDGQQTSAQLRASPTSSPQENPIDGIVGATYPLRRWREAIDHALGAGKLGTLKVAFDPRPTDQD